MALAELESALRRDLDRLAYPPENWVIGPPGEDFDCDVLVIGGGMCGLTAGFALLRQGIRSIRILDAARPGLEGPWVTYARMRTLRSPKHLTGPAQGLPNLTVRAWFEAQWGERAWEALEKIPRAMWMDYLRWYRQVLALPVENGKRVVAIVPTDRGFDVEVRSERGVETVRARRVVLATGREGIASPRIPPVLAGVRRDPVGRRCHHSSEPIDFASMRGQRLAVLGLGASALDNAAQALEAGARAVTLLGRAPAMPRINKAKGIVYAGFTHGFPRLGDAERFRMFTYIFECRVAPPRESLLRAARHEAFSLRLGSSVAAVRDDGDSLELSLASGATLTVDQVILATGFKIDLDAAPELGALAPRIARWRDRHIPREEGALTEFLDFPYLGSNFEFLEREPGTEPSLARLHCFNFAAALSLGNLSSDIPAVSEGADRLARGIAESFFIEDQALYWRNMQAYVEPELTGDEVPSLEWSPAP